MMLLAGPATAGDLLFQGAQADPSAGLALDLKPSLDGVLPGSLGGSVRQAISRDVAQAAVALTHLDLGDVLASGWQKHSELRAAGRRTREAPGTQETVVLAEHRIAYDAHPYVDVLLSGAHLTRVTLTLLLTADVTGLAGSVNGGRLTGLSAGRAVLTAAFEVAGAPVARRSTELRLPVDLGLGEGLRLA
ncbi:MAG TPA: hypothetical protein VES93_07785 [Ornithinibacter sp.]|nr:hypothetical protein [Ornithinibacter sp.]